jgi:hypothetical protein
MRPFEAAILLPQKWCFSPAPSQANERLAVRNLLPLTRSMKQFAENLRLRDISRSRCAQSRTLHFSTAIRHLWPACTASDDS